MCKSNKPLLEIMIISEIQCRWYTDSSFVCLQYNFKICRFVIDNLQGYHVLVTYKNTTNLVSLNMHVLKRNLFKLIIKIKKTYLECKT
jgi:hypothetical protein